VKPVELIGNTVGQVDHSVNRHDTVLFALGNHEIPEHEPAIRAEHGGNAAKEVSLPLAVEVVDGKDAHHEVERSLRKRILETAELESRVGKPVARPAQHSLARVDRSKTGTGVQRKDSARSLAGTDSELEQVTNLSALCCSRSTILQLAIAGHLDLNVV
jgi:hypothetical protein